jgi:hypothetical protein
LLTFIYNGFIFKKKVFGLVYKLTFKKGHIWGVGDGKNFNIWKDEWILGYYSRKVITLKGQNVYTRVSELIGIDVITLQRGLGDPLSPYLFLFVRRLFRHC